ncbi:wall-associated receptor kinase 3-like [Papaver somniferum]|uniref:wall-associated receptor kinase 3-like n=1 Tax=Papaver somniferum TaxID=3469 RepID=UPI000E70012F|nr:wall-associated receptor kinase 3-like [Papaver somniferum]
MDNKPFFGVVFDKTPFTVSQTKIRLFGVGCNTTAYIEAEIDSIRTRLVANCSSQCESRDKVIEMSCTGSGCCQITIPKLVKGFFGSAGGEVWPFNPCSYGFVAELDSFTFTAVDLVGIRRKDRDVISMALDWAIRHETCIEARKNTSTYMCQANSYCKDPVNNPGYQCFCNEDYEGNPYLKPGCVGICSGLLVFLIIGGSCLYLIMKKRKLKKDRNVFFEQNGSLLLEQKLSSNEVGADSTKIFSPEDLERCCLETKVPLLVYEYDSNGTLYEHIHLNDGMSSISWNSLLRIATEISSALAYLHSYVSIPIFHRDIKSTNVLLDENYTVKVSHFGASREKSLSFERSEEQRNLAIYFISLLEVNDFSHILDSRVLNEGKPEHVLAVAELAKGCLNSKCQDRPTMKQVAAKLEDLRSLEKEPHQPIHEESENFPVEVDKDFYVVPLMSSHGTASSYN